jgi:hypothetical protein
MNQPNPDAAFEAAIAEGRLSADPASPIYAGKYMFMGCRADGTATFKHIDTREYLPAPKSDAQAIADIRDRMREEIASSGSC